MHFYPGVAQYDSPDGSFRVFINEDTIRKMNPSFEGRPVFVDHVEEVDADVNQLRNEADGWVIESFYNEADGKTWAKFIIVSDRGLAAIKKGFRLSNAYIPQLNDTKATWNGVDYQKVVMSGEFEHLAIVKNPRYEESVIMSPDEFKSYNERHKAELKRLANSKDKKGDTVRFFKRQKIENAIDIENTIVELPKSKKEMALAQIINDHDAILNMNGYANGDHFVKLNDKEELSVNDLVKKHLETCNELEQLKAKNAEGAEGGEPGKGKDDLDVQVENEDLDEDQNGKRDDDGDKSVENEDKNEGKRDPDGDESIDNEEDEDGGEGKKDRPGKDAFEKKSVKNKKDEEARTKARALKNAHLMANANMETVRVDLAMDQVARGKSRYGSN